MRTAEITATLMLITLLVQPGCTAYHGASNSDRPRPPGYTFTTPELDRTQDHLIAWIPQDRAQTPAVAEALVHVELANAKEHVGSELCGGAWLVDGEVTERYGPVPATAPQELGGYAAWYYRISQQPGLKGCSGSPAIELYRELRNSLPQWIQLQTSAATPPQEDPSAATVSLVK